MLNDLEKAGGYFSLGIDSTSMQNGRYYALVIRFL